MIICFFFPEILRSPIVSTYLSERGSWSKLETDFSLVLYCMPFQGPRIIGESHITFHFFKYLLFDGEYTQPVKTKNPFWTFSDFSNKGIKPFFPDNKTIEITIWVSVRFRFSKKKTSILFLPKFRSKPIIFGPK